MTVANRSRLQDNSLFSIHLELTSGSGSKKDKLLQLIPFVVKCMVKENKQQNVFVKLFLLGVLSYVNVPAKVQTTVQVDATWYMFNPVGFAFTL